jgi:hypothetical protein
MSPRALAATLPRITKAILEKGGRDYAALIAEWPGIVGAALATSSLPEKLARRPAAAGRAASGVLTIRVTGGAAMEFQHREPQLIERINAYLGHSAVMRLKLVQGPIPGRAAAGGWAPRPLSPAESKAIEADVANVTDDELRTRLTRLGRAMAARHGSRRRPEK